MFETVAFDFVGLALLMLWLAVIVMPGPRRPGRRIYTVDEGHAVADKHSPEMSSVISGRAMENA